MLWVNPTSSPSGLRPGADKGVRATNLVSRGSAFSGAWLTLHVPHPTSMLVPSELQLDYVLVDGRLSATVNPRVQQAPLVCLVTESAEKNLRTHPWSGHREWFPVTLHWLRFVKLIPTRVTWEQGLSVEELPPSDWPAGYSVYIYFD